MAVIEGAWSETALITITKYAAGGGTDVEYASLIETIDLDLGEKDVEFRPNLKGGNIIKKIPQAGTTLTFEGYPVDIDAAGGTGVSQMFHGGTWNTSEPMTVTASTSRDIFRIAILFTDDTTATSAAGETAASSNSYRWVFVHAYMTSMKPSFTDQILKFTFTFKVAPFNKNGVALIREDSGDATALVALNTYNSTNYPPTGSIAYTW